MGGQKGEGREGVIANYNRATSCSVGNSFSPPLDAFQSHPSVLCMCTTLPHFTLCMEFKIRRGAFTIML